MRSKTLVVAACGVLAGCTAAPIAQGTNVVVQQAQQLQPAPGAVPAPGTGLTLNQAQQDSVIRPMVARLELERYKATIKGLTMFGDRRQGTDRNRAAIDWIEAQLKSYGCTNTERLNYEFTRRMLQTDSTRRVDSIATAAAVARGGGAAAAGAGAGRGTGGGGGGGGAGRGTGGGGGRGAAVVLTPADSARLRTLQTAMAAGRGVSAADSAFVTASTGRGGRGGNRGGGGGGGRGGNPPKGFTAPTGVNTNPMLQPDTALRRLNMQPDTPGPRQEVYCTKIGTTRPDEMYIIGAHMDGHGMGSAANDDGSGTALVMELARVFSSPDVVTERSIRFILFNNEETGGGASAYALQRAPLRGIENPVGSGKYPEPKWLGMIQHDMMMWDHGMPGPDGKLNPEQRREADVNVEFAGASRYADDASKLAFYFRRMNDRYATDYPAAVGDRMSNTDSGSFQDLCPAISLRENERLAHTGTGWNPTWHQPIDVYSTFSDKDFRLGLNAAQTTLSAVAALTGATLKK